MEKTLFQKICDKELPAKIVFEDDKVVAFHDVDPKAPTHVLIVPRKPLARIGEAQPDDHALLGHLLLKAAEVARSLNLDGGYRLVLNNGPDGGESVPHLHLHIMGGRQFRWPPG
jgi:histidine triad (HIT) family protein